MSFEITYSFLAYMNEQNEMKINDFSDVFIPVVEHSLFLISDNNKQGGNIGELHDMVLKFYNINFPMDLLKKILTKIKVIKNNEFPDSLMVYNDGSFVFNDLPFVNFGEQYNNQKSELITLENDYDTYMVNLQEKSTVNDLYLFLEDNHDTMLSLINGSSRTTEIKSNFLQAKYIEHIKVNKPNIFRTLKKIYIGSLMHSYLNTNLAVNPPKSRENKTLVLDTNFIISLLGLHPDDQVRTCRKVVEYANSFSYELILPAFTIREIKQLLEKKIENFASSSLFDGIRDADIVTTCKRNKINQADLTRMKNSLEEILQEKYNITISNRSETFFDLAKASPLTENLAKSKPNPDGAQHDAASILFVRSLRGHKNFSKFEDVNAWVVSDTMYNTLKTHNPKGYLLERIGAHTLLNMFWLCSPNALCDSNHYEMSLKRLVSSTLRSNQPTARDLVLLENNIKKYTSDFDIKPSEYYHLVTSIAAKSIDEIQSLNDSAINDQEKFIQDINNMAKMSRHANELQDKRHKETQEQFLKAEKENTQLKELIQENNEKLNNIQDDLNEKVKKEKQLIKASKEKTEELLNDKNTLLDSAKTRLNSINDSIQDANKTSETIMKLFGLIIIGVTMYFAYSTYVISTIQFNKIEGLWTYSGLGIFGFTLLLGIRNRQDFTTKMTSLQLQAKKIDTSIISDLESEIAQLNFIIEKYEKELQIYSIQLNEHAV